ncbi:MAG: NADPH-dependent 7-cyano-7-deazaguanine reductase QueF [Rickettsiales bacterium]|nr:NADPH-dependent 7-cyano-7-deazaguanine reductase QueF [Rickettsiales bacterium]|tara:strand:+ start:1357 stop:1815 length:459 start_codon:yes stop_codon:yes gene_type:complete
MSITKKPSYLGSKSQVPESPKNFKLDGIDNPHRDKDYVVRFSSPELTSICPITSQPDFGYIVLDYIPKKLILESKSLKLFLFSFRNFGGFHEDCTILIAKKIEHFIKPKWLRISCFWNPRGGIPIDIFYENGKKPKNVFIKEVDIKPYTGRF